MGSTQFIERPTNLIRVESDLIVMALIKIDTDTEEDTRVTQEKGIRRFSIKSYVIWFTTWSDRKVSNFADLITSWNILYTSVKSYGFACLYVNPFFELTITGLNMVYSMVQDGL